MRRVSRVLALAALVALVVLSAACGDDDGPHDVEVYSAVERGPTSLMVVVAECHGHPYEVTVEDGADEVRITVRASSASEDSCADSVEVELPTALDGRRLVDDSTGDEIPVE